MKNLIVIVLAFYSLTSYSQTPVIERDVNVERLSTDNQSVKTYLHFGTNLNLDESVDLKTKWSSGNIGYGASGKLVSSRIYSLVLAGYYRFDNYKVIQDTINLLNAGIENKSKTYIATLLNLG